MSVVEKIKQVFGDFDVVTFLKEHKVKYDEWLKSQIFQLLTAVEKDVLKILSGYTIMEKHKLQEFWDWLKKTEWRGVSSEVVEEFQERFAELGVKPVKKEVPNKQ